MNPGSGIIITALHQATDLRISLRNSVGVCPYVLLEHTGEAGLLLIAEIETDQAALFPSKL